MLYLKSTRKGFFSVFHWAKYFLKGFRFFSLSTYIYLIKIFIVVLCFCLNFLKSYHNKESLKNQTQIKSLETNRHGVWFSSLRWAMWLRATDPRPLSLSLCSLASSLLFYSLSYLLSSEVLSCAAALKWLMAIKCV